MDRRISYKIVLDCETAPCDNTINSVTPTNMLVYDLGWVVTDKRGTVYETKSFINADVFLGEKGLMQSAYYAKKIPQYWEDIKSGKRVLTSFYNIRQELLKDIKKYEVEQIFAHNMLFDNGSLNNTQRWETKSKYRYFFPKDVTICDTLKMARQLVATMPTYQRFCEANGYMTKHSTPRPRLTAEILYRFISGDSEFAENHTGLEDCMIEKEIMAYCYRKHKKMNVELFSRGN